MEYLKDVLVRNPNKHEWGVGRIVADSDGLSVQIDFEVVGLKTLSLEYVQPEIVTNKDHTVKISKVTDSSGMTDDMSVAEEVILFLDLETTGLPLSRGQTYRNIENWPRWVSICWAIHKSEDQSIVHKYSVVRPQGYSIPSESTKIHGITNEYAAKHGRSTAEIIREFNNDLVRYKPNKLVAHNVEFDRNVFLAEVLRNNMKTTMGELPCLCTMMATINYCQLPRRGGGYKYPKLEELYTELFDDYFDNAHNASADVEACVSCYYEIERRGIVSNCAGEVTQVSKKQDLLSSYAQELLDKIYLWVFDNEWFDTDFVDDLQETLDEFGVLTRKQIIALENIIDKCEIE